MEYLTPKERKTNPQEKTNFFLTLLFLHTRKLFVKGAKKHLDEEDIYNVLPSHKSQKLGDQLESQWENQRLEKQPSMFHLLFTCFGRQYMILVSSQLILITAIILRPKIIKYFISYFTPNHNNLTKPEACMIGASFIIVQFIEFVYVDNFHLALETFGIKIRTALTSLIYRKVLKINLSQRDDLSVGKIITLITRDVNEFDISVLYATLLWCDSILFFVTCYVIYLEVGSLVLVLLGIFCFIMLIQVFLAKILAALKIKTLKTTDQRYQATKEMLDGLTLIKSYIWGESYKAKVSKIRKNEVSLVYKTYLLLVVKFILSALVLNVVYYVLAISSRWFGMQIKIETIFFLLTSLEGLSHPLKLTIPRGMHEIVKSVAVLKRIENILRTIDAQSPFKHNNSNVLPARIIAADLNVHLKGKKMFHNVNLKLKNGLTVLTGSTGSGKSLLLQVMLQEYKSITGNLAINGRVSYVSQQSWLFPSTIKQNILFGASYDAERYRKVLKVCALAQDLQYLQGGDGFIVADRGSNISKGQQSRINLARALYQDREIYLLDDCLTHLDVLVRDYVFEKSIKQFLKDKLVVLVTQNPKHISRADGVIVLKNQTVKFVQQENPVEVFQNVTISWKTEEIKLPSDIGEQDEDLNESTSLAIMKDCDENIYRENIHPGKVEFETYKMYVEHGGGIINFIGLCFLFGVVQFLKSGMKKLENNWISTEQDILTYTANNATNEIHYRNALDDRDKMTWLFPIVLVTVATATLLKATLYYHFTKKASLSLHRLLIEKVLNASMFFFNNHYVGNILNRFSEDLLYVDERVSYSLYILLEAFTEIIGITILMASMNVTLLLVSSLLCVLLIIVAIFYLKTGRALKRLEISTRCSFIGHVNATAEGLSTIRSSKVENILCEEFDRHQDLYASASYLYLCCLKAFIFVTKMFVISLMIYAIILPLATNVKSAAHVGFILSQVVLFRRSLDLGFRRFPRLENEMTAVERILEYTKQAQEYKCGAFVKDWPQRGEIKFSDVYFSYDSSNYVLRNLNFTIEPQQVVAVVGRTASGKSSIISTLLRMYKLEGKIFIDGVNIATFPLDTLRSNVSVIAQDPVLFTGTVRENVDLTGKYTDEEIWNALRTVKLEKLFDNLDHRISSAEANLCLGQKQLLCLARAIVRNNKIIVMDEVAAHMDRESEEMIFKIVREKIADCTVLMITHNLDYIRECDKVMVLNNGRIVEYDCPSVLLNDQNGLLYRMFKKTFI